jgi:hypothetical protein
MIICQACINDEEVEIPESVSKFVLCDRHQDRMDAEEIEIAQATVSQNYFNSAKSVSVQITTRSGKRIGGIK